MTKDKPDYLQVAKDELALSFRVRGRHDPSPLLAAHAAALIAQAETLEAILALLETSISPSLARTAGYI